MKCFCGFQTLRLLMFRLEMVKKIMFRLEKKEKFLLNYATDLIKSKGFDFYTVPWMVKPQYLVGTGYFPWGEEDHYKNQDGMGLIGTAEVSLTSYYAGEVLEEKDLPIKLAGISSCFRREIGSYGKDTRGIFRVHQFMKVEQVVLLPEGEELSREGHERMLGEFFTLW